MSNIARKRRFWCSFFLGDHGQSSCSRAGFCVRCYDDDDDFDRKKKKVLTFRLSQTVIILYKEGEIVQKHICVPTFSIVLKKLWSRRSLKKKERERGNRSSSAPGSSTKISELCTLRLCFS